MSGVIKAAERPGWVPRRVEGHGPTWAPPAPPPTADRLLADALNLRLIAAEAALAEAEESLSRANADHALSVEGARRDAFEAGRQAGLDGKAEATAALRDGVADALLRLDERMIALERLSLLLARDGLERILGASSPQGDLVLRALRKQMGLVQANSVLEVRVAPSDFTEAQVVELQAELGPAIALVSDAGLTSGRCRLALKLGEAEVGVADQWANLRADLERLLETS